MQKICQFSAEGRLKAFQKSEQKNLPCLSEEGCRQTDLWLPVAAQNHIIFFLFSQRFEEETELKKIMIKKYAIKLKTRVPPLVVVVVMMVLKLDLLQLILKLKDMQRTFRLQSAVEYSKSSKHDLIFHSIVSSS